jgi:uncharacterized protein
MSKIETLLYRFFDRVILGYPRWVIACLILVISILGYHAKDFKIDASSDTLIKQSDESFRYARNMYSRYGVGDFLIISYTPNKDLLSDDVLADIARLRDEIKALPRVESVVTLLDVPLLESPPLSVKELASDIHTLSSPGVDRNLARHELANSPIYRNLVVSPDLKTTAIQVNFKLEKKYNDLVQHRDRMEDKAATKGLSNLESIEYKAILSEIEDLKKTSDAHRHQDIVSVREIMSRHQKDAKLFLGGVSMIADDLIRFVRNDLKIFGTGVFVFLIITLAAIFKMWRWVVLPMACCFLSALAMIGILGLFGWKVTVVSANFISLQLIISMTYTIHLVVRYRELQGRYPDDDQHALCSKMIRYMLLPTFYGALTTIVGFESLILCDILPVATFGWMMSAGICVSLTLTFLLFPAWLMLLKKPPQPVIHETHASFTPALGRFTESNKTLILVVSAIIVILSYFGISKLQVENSFINYFKESTEIYQGMKVIDQELGGTTPLDVIIDFNEPDLSASSAKNSASGKSSDGSDSFEGFDEFDEQPQNKYWFTPYKMNRILEVHDYLEKLPGAGKVLSLGTMMKVATKLNNGKPLDSFDLSLAYNEIPDKYKDLLVKPFASVEKNQARIFMRVRDSDPAVRRNELIHRIQHDLTERMGFKKEDVHVTGLLVLYNNMLQTLFSSQFATLGSTVFIMMCMYLVMFRSLSTSLIAIAPNLFSIGAILGFMGWWGLPLDMMTITIASISVSIADDNIIQYIYRFMDEFKIDANYIKAMHRSHGSIGYDMYYTTITLVIGFSILALSNFIPSIVFGLLTGLVMVIALFASLTLLPVMIVVIRPFGPEKPVTA